jgi:hemerythrin superfamily protein
MRDGAEALKGERGIFRKLKEEHTEIAVLMDRISASTDTDTRVVVFPDVLTGLIALGRAEETEFYGVLLKYETTRAMARHALDEQRDIGALLDQVDRADPREAAWSEAFDRMKRLTEQHFSEEEHVLFPEARKVLTEEEAHAIGGRFEARLATEKEQLSSSV